jgi:type II secretory pathway pseudopilin PulG
MAATVLVVGVLAAALFTDAQAQLRARHERAALLALRQQMSSTRRVLSSLTDARNTAAATRRALGDSVGTILGQMEATDDTLTTTDRTASGLGLDMTTLHTCLGGVQSAYRQIAAHDSPGATADLSGVSTACLTLDSGQDEGLVYPFDFPDPFVLRVGGTYFAYATNSAEGNIQIIESTDLTQWRAVGNALPALPKWARSGGTWAPSVLQVGGTFVLYYAAVVATGGEECISVATATQPQGPFTDDSSSPLECQAALGGSIDPSPFVDTDGTPYLEWKSNGGAGQGATLWSEQLTSSGTAFAGVAPTQLLEPDQSWEGGVIEAPDLVVSGGRYFLFYSGNDWDSANYAVAAATCRGPLGPCRDLVSQPILVSGSSMSGPGGESVFSDPSGSLWMAFAAWQPGAVGYPHSRVLFLRRLNLG